MRGKSPTAAAMATDERARLSRSAAAAAPIHTATAERERPAMNEGLSYHISDRWAHCYPGMEVAVVTNMDKPPVPPEGFVPRRLGVHHQHHESDGDDKDEDMEGFSVDTLMWSDELLASRLDDLMQWTRREPLSLREKLDRINWLVNSV